LVKRIIGQSSGITTTPNRLESHGTDIAAYISEMAEKALSPKDTKATFERVPPDD
jgi:hypothetical protein